jgi:hypothetical protein
MHHCPKLPTLLLALLPLLALQAQADGGKPKPNDPVRKDIVAAIRNHPAYAGLKGSKLDIRRIWASERFGYVCMLVIDKDGQHQRTDDAYTVHQIVLKHEADKWAPVAHIDGFSESSKQVQCASDAHGKVTDAFLEEVANNPHLAL